MYGWGNGHEVDEMHRGIVIRGRDRSRRAHRIGACWLRPRVETKAVQDIDRYEQMQGSMALLKMLALGNRQIDAGRVQPAAEVIARLRERHQAD